MPRTRPAATSVYQVLVTLQYIEPAIWRCLLLPSDLRLGKLHRVLQCVFGWENYHLHEFVVGDTFYGVPDPEWGDDPPTIDERTVPIRRVLTKVGDVIVYEYDFGDGWRHDLVLEQTLPVDPDRSSLLCMAGARARPPEDVGGVWGYANFLEAINDPEHEEHDALLTWVGGVFDPEGCDVNMINRRLSVVAVANTLLMKLMYTDNCYFERVSEKPFLQNVPTVSTTLCART